MSFCTRAVRLPSWFIREGAVHLTPLSDVHLGHAFTDEALVKSDLESAVEGGDVVLINGDLTDGILPTDKRFAPHLPAPWLSRRDDQLDAVVSRGGRIFGPAADNIMLFGYGNHDTKVIQMYGTDPVARIAEEVGRSEAVGTYCGYLTLRAGRKRLTVGYWHGKGGGGKSGVQGAVTLIRHAASVLSDADLILVGHCHHRAVVDIPTLGRAGVRRRLGVCTGSYMRSYELTRAQGPKSNFVSEGLMPPGGLGGVRIRWDLKTGGLSCVRF